MSAYSGGRYSRLIRPLSARLWENVRFGPDCWEWTGAPTRQGYGQIARGRRGEGLLLAHRAAWIVTFGPIPDGLHVLHRCDNGLCVKPAHLFLGTQADNMRDMAQKARGNGAKISGERNFLAKLTNEQAAAIRLMPGSERVLARKFGVSHTVIGDIRRGRSYRAA